MAKEILLVTACFYPDDSPAKHLIRSCRKFGIPLSVFGVGEKFEGYCQSKITRLRDHLLSLPNRDVIYVDSSDVVVALPYRELIVRYNKVQRENGWRVTLAADHVLHPPSIRKPVFEKLRRSGSLFRYPCAGVICGKRTKLITALNGVIKVWEDTREAVEEKHKDNDQGYWIEAIGSGAVEAGLDYNARVSLSLHHYKKGWFASTKPEVVLSTGITPALLHFNGAVPKRSLMKRYLKTGGL